MNEKMRIDNHPVLGKVEKRKAVTIYFNGEPLSAREGDTISAALYAAGIRALRETERFHTQRGVYCGMGRCDDCLMTVDGEANVLACVTLVKDGMHVEKQYGLK